MPILKFPSGSYVNADAVEKELRYVFGKSLAKGGMSVDPEHAAPQMQMVKTVWGQADGKCSTILFSPFRTSNHSGSAA